MHRILTLALCLAVAGCTFRLAHEPYDQGYSATPRADGRHDVRYRGKGMESAAALERLLRRGVATTCGDDDFRLDDVAFAIEEVMERTWPRFRSVSAVADCE